LASLRAVDLVVIFDEDTPANLIQVLRPQLLVKGNHYRPEDVVGADLVRSWGGELYLPKILPGRSTTLTIEKLERGA
jgi:D-beta-D-heptose 7-phosphate kinase/D-beta-D-heptose 1-phosphate adenosyltransferase